MADIREMNELIDTVLAVFRGPGIAPEHLETVLQAFYRVESSRNRHTGGAGLGLYIARDLPQRQGGRLVLSNPPQGGLRAEVVLPRRTKGSTEF